MIVEEQKAMKRLSERIPTFGVTHGSPWVPEHVTISETFTSYKLNRINTLKGSVQLPGESLSQVELYLLGNQNSITGQISNGHGYRK